MNHFMKYMHVERIDKDNLEVMGLLDGDVYVQPKIDGTNTSVWYADGMLHFGKRTQEMGDGDDNRGVKEKYLKDERYINLLKASQLDTLWGMVGSSHNQDIFCDGMEDIVHIRCCRMR